MRRRLFFSKVLRTFRQALVRRRPRRLRDDGAMTKARIDTSGKGNPLAHNPFAELAVPVVNPRHDAKGGTPAARVSRPKDRTKRGRGRVDVIRQTAGRGGKTVTVLTGFKGIASSELQTLAREIQRACGVGGTVRPGTIEIQGDQRDRACVALEAAGFRPVRAGG